MWNSLIKYEKEQQHKVDAVIYIGLFSITPIDVSTEQNSKHDKIRNDDEIEDENDETHDKNRNSDDNINDKKRNDDNINDKNTSDKDDNKK